MSFVPPLALSLCLTTGVFAASSQESKPQTPPVPKLRPTTAPAEGLPEVKKVLEQTVKAMGGRAALEKIKSGHTKAALSSPMGQMDIDTYWHQPDRILINQALAGMGEFQTGHDGTVGWTTNPMTGQYELLEAEQIEGMKGQATIHMTLANLEKEYKQIKIVDLTDFDGRPCYKLHIMKKARDANAAPDITPVDEEQTFMFIDTKTKLFAGMENEAETQMGPMKIQIKFRDWKEIQGVKFFQKMVVDQMGMEMEINYSAIELNKVDPAIFKAPAEVKELAAKRKANKPTSQPDEGSHDHGHDGHDHGHDGHDHGHGGGNE